MRGGVEFTRVNGRAQELLEVCRLFESSRMKEDNRRVCTRMIGRG